MISFNNIGNMGRLGNQMFQYAALKGISAHNGYEYSVATNNSLFECFKIPVTIPNHNIQTISSEKFEFDEEFFNTCPDNIDIVGYFQSQKYFKHIEEEIRQNFTFCDRIYKICKHYRTHILSKEVISLHIRRTDYITDSNFSILSTEYYDQALKQLPNLPVIVFSDDFDWCKKYFISDRFKVSMSNNSYIDLCLMTMCDYHIIANSSFSWWGSYLSQSKKTIAPKLWFSGEFSSWNIKDLYLPNWTII